LDNEECVLFFFGCFLFFFVFFALQGFFFMQGNTPQAKIKNIRNSATGDELGNDAFFRGVSFFYFISGHSVNK
jgi:hypothetical protein